MAKGKKDKMTNNDKQNDTHKTKNKQHESHEYPGDTSCVKHA